jgi:hypothetical protein
MGTASLSEVLIPRQGQVRRGISVIQCTSWCQINKQTKHKFFCTLFIANGIDREACAHSSLRFQFITHSFIHTENNCQQCYLEYSFGAEIQTSDSPFAGPNKVEGKVCVTVPTTEIAQSQAFSLIHRWFCVLLETMSWLCTYTNPKIICKSMNETEISKIAQVPLT